MTSVAGGGAVTALRHPGLPPEPHDLLAAWTWEPTALLSLVLFASLYALGVRALWRQAGRGRGVPIWRVVAFAGGILALFVGLISPIDALGAVLFSAHMLQHMLLMLVAVPLLVLGRPHVAMPWAARPTVRRQLGVHWRRFGALRAAWRAVTHPVIVWVLHAATIWLWHLPGPYQAALTSEAVHAAEHVSFLGTALLFWWSLPGIGPHPRLNPAIGVLYLFTFTLQGGVLGALITFAGSPWYPSYAATSTRWGLTPLDDQQLAGMLMSVPAGLVYVVAALVPLASWLEAENDPPPRLQGGRIDEPDRAQHGRRLTTRQAVAGPVAVHQAVVRQVSPDAIDGRWDPGTGRG